MVTLLQAVGLETITPKYIYFNVCYNEQVSRTNCLKNNQHDVTCGLSFIFVGIRHSLSTCFELSGSRTRRRTGGLQQRLHTIPEADYRKMIS